jgi:hypothetical protein
VQWVTVVTQLSCPTTFVLVTVAEEVVGVALEGEGVTEVLAGMASES